MHHSVFTEGLPVLAATQDDGHIKIFQHLANRDQVVVSQLYLVGSMMSDSYPIAKLLQIPATLIGQNRFALLTFQVGCSSRSCVEATEILKRLRNESTLSAER